jgi:hypothetical protein
MKKKSTQLTQSTQRSYSFAPTSFKKPSVKFTYNDVVHNHNTKKVMHDMAQVSDTTTWRTLCNAFALLTTYVTPHERGSYLWYAVIEKILGRPLTYDGFGNAYFVVGKQPTVMFTSHVDTVSSASTNFNRSFDGRFMQTDGKTILGADDKSGVASMLTMILHGKHGLYYFFDGEECGGIGSRKVAKAFATQRQFDGITYCISLDRKGYTDIITHQAGSQCCSGLFAQTLSDELARHGMFLEASDGGVYTDSAEFVDLIPECTNLSVGYFGAHGGNERQDMMFLHQLTVALIQADYSRLQTEPIPKQTYFVDSWDNYSYGYGKSYSYGKGYAKSTTPKSYPTFDADYTDDTDTDSNSIAKATALALMRAYDVLVSSWDGYESFMNALKSAKVSKAVVDAMAECQTAIDLQVDTVAVFLKHGKRITEAESALIDAMW